ncbi:MAG: ric [Flavipsychrobacter sp.]|jgi:regulator of cell morphogenesis and NO signaling|nr:ric [Flavipsychrobacter sp.]
MNNVFIDVTVLEPRMKHPTIFDAFDSVAEGYAVVIHNDHDPKPLYYQLLGERGNCFSWTYLSNGPEIWEVEIKKNEKNSETIGEIASKDMRKAQLLKKLGIDFCCGGKRSLEEACIDKGLDVHRVKEELQNAERATQAGPNLDFNSWTLSFLADYIINVHHTYVKESTQLLGELSEKVATHHGQNNPILVDIRNKTHELLRELNTHLKKEEQILFPYIKLLETPGFDKNKPHGFDSVKSPIWMMESEHDAAGALAREIRTLTNDYTRPANSCNSVGLLYHKLEEFENDLIQHIHLENNILFPKAIELENKL